MRRLALRGPLPEDLRRRLPVSGSRTFVWCSEPSLLLQPSGSGFPREPGRRGEIPSCLVELYDDWLEFGLDGRDAGEVYRWASDHDISDPAELLVMRTHGIDDMLEHVKRLATAIGAELECEGKETTCSS